ncbi:MAG: arylesterase [Betaproteobacteria bacterium]|nr:arylesterase [Betaproteobacteria bacterium]
MPVDTVLHAFRRLGAAVLLALLAACGPSVPKVAKLDAGATILAFGDSLTFGTGAAPNDAYPAQLERVVGRKIVNAGVPGEISADGLKRLPEVLDEVKPKLLILCHGGNDFLRKLSEADAAANIRGMIHEAKGRGIEVVLMATPKPGLPPSVPAFYADIAREFGLPMQDDVIKSVLFDNAKKSDLVHPNAQGYGEMAQALAKLLKKAGAV